MYDKENIVPDKNEGKEELIELLSNDICWLNAHIHRLYQTVPANTIIAVKRDIRAFLLGVADHLTKGLDEER